MKVALFSVAFSLCGAILGVVEITTAQEAGAPTPEPAAVSVLSAQGPDASLPSVAFRRGAITAALQNPQPVIPLSNLTEGQAKAQELALRHPEFIRYTVAQNGERYLNEVFGVYPVRPGDNVPGAGSTPAGSYRVELYNFSLNLASSCVVDTQQATVSQIVHLPQTQPDIPESLKRVALDIALHSPDVMNALGKKPTERDALMASTKTSLNRTRCERSRHLCVAPTFVSGDKALWVIVDLTDLRIVGMRWTNVGLTGVAVVTEKNLQNEHLADNFCERSQSVKREGWELGYHLTTSDGLEVTAVRFKEVPILESVKLVDWHVSYSNTDGFGYSDAIGCPVFSQATVVANKPAQIEEIRVNDKVEGFALVQEYFNQGWPTPCNYNYVQRYEFYRDGRFRVKTASVGRGCGNDATYRPVFRIAFADGRTFSQYTDAGWSPWEREQWTRQEDLTRYSKEGYQFKIEGKGYSYFLEPSRGQFADGGRGDFAYTYLTRRKPGEGDTNLITIGPCCNTDFHQGPERFIDPDPESLKGGGFVMWYVPTLKNDDRVGREYCWAESVLVDGVYQAKTYPCYAGPMFVPAKVRGR